MWLCVWRREFPTSLSKAQRKFAHNQARRMGMQTKSVGKEGVNRRLTVHQEPKGDEKPSSEVHIHPSSVNSRTMDFLPFLVYLEKIKTTRVFLRDCTPVSPYPIMLFGGRLCLTPHSAVGPGYSEITMGDEDSWITFVMRHDVARLIRSLRQMLDQL